MKKKIEELLKKYDLENARIEVTNTHGKMFTSSWTTEVKSYLVDDILDAFREVLPEKLSEVYEQAVKVNNYAWGSDLDFDDARIGWNKCIEEIESKLGARSN